MTPFTEGPLATLLDDALPVAEFREPSANIEALGWKAVFGEVEEDDGGSVVEATSKRLVRH